jgi:hypothetical protein
MSPPVAHLRELGGVRHGCRSASEGASPTQQHCENKINENKTSGCSNGKEPAAESMPEPAQTLPSRTVPRDAAAPVSNGGVSATAAAVAQGRVAAVSNQPATRLRDIKVQMNKPGVNTKLGIALENSPPGTCPRVRRVGADGAAAGVLEPDDVIIELDGQPLDVGTAAATELLRSHVGTLVLTVRRAVTLGEEDEIEFGREAGTIEGRAVEEEEEEGEDVRRIMAALAELRAKAMCKSEGAQDTLENAAEETVRLATALQEATLGGHQELMALVVRKTQARCAKEKAIAVEAATAAAARATEVRLKGKHAREMKKALEAAAQQASIDQEAAVAAAVRETEERCAEQQRLAVLYATELTQSQLGMSADAVAASTATMAFREAADSAGAALAAAMRLHKEQAAPTVAETEEEPADNNVYFF